jgi:hypothetical protein
MNRKRGNFQDKEKLTEAANEKKMNVTYEEDWVSLLACV